MPNCFPFTMCFFFVRLQYCRGSRSSNITPSSGLEIRPPNRNSLLWCRCWLYNAQSWKFIFAFYMDFGWLCLQKWRMTKQICFCSAFFKFDFWKFFETYTLKFWTFLCCHVLSNWTWKSSSKSSCSIYDLLYMFYCRSCFIISEFIFIFASKDMHSWATELSMTPNSVINFCMFSEIGSVPFFNSFYFFGLLLWDWLLR